MEIYDFSYDSEIDFFLSRKIKYSSDIETILSLSKMWKLGGCHSSVDSSAPAIQRPQVQLQSTRSTLRTKISKMRPGIWKQSQCKIRVILGLCCR